MDSLPSIDLLAMAMRPETTTNNSSGVSPSRNRTSPRRRSRSFPASVIAARDLSSRLANRVVSRKSVVSGMSSGHASEVFCQPLPPKIGLVRIPVVGSVPGTSG